jgi:hypothetical protein
MIARNNAKVIQGSVVSSDVTSYAKVFPTGVALDTTQRTGISTFAVQNLETVNSVQFWYGQIPADPLVPEGTLLPVDPSDWDGTQATQAANCLSTYGETLGPGQYLESFVASSGIFYTYVATGTVTAHTKEG